MRFSIIISAALAGIALGAPAIENRENVSKDNADSQDMIAKVAQVADFLDKVLEVVKNAPIS